MLRNLWLKLKVRLFISGKVKVGSGLHIGILSYVSSYGGLEVGNDVYVGKFCSIECSGKIGSGVLIANNVGIVGRRDHDLRQLGVPISRAKWVGSEPNLAGLPQNSVEIGDDVWIGYGAVVLSGIKVGRGAIIAAGAVVSADVAPYVIVAGNPAREVGSRFSLDQQALHESMIRKQS